MVHFDLRFDPRFGTISVSDVVNILSGEMGQNSPRYLTNLTIDPKSLEIQESLMALNAEVALQTTASTTTPTTTLPPPRKCGKVEFNYCRHLPYNITSYPNILGHQSIREVEEDVITFRYVINFRHFWDIIEVVNDFTLKRKLMGDF